VKARNYVLATGGLENARLLLLSNKVMTAGLGNQNDLVGRFFMEHPHLSGFGEIVIADVKRLPRIYRERVRADGRTATAAFNASESFLRKQRLLNATFMMAVAATYLDDSKPTTGMRSADAHIAMLKAAKHFLLANRKARQPQNPNQIGVWMGLGCSCEQIPNPASRVVLSEQRDALGLPRIRLNWRLTQQDRRSVVEHMRSLALEFGLHDLGRMMLNVEDDGRWPDRVGGGNHHMGTTRMSDNPKQGVVNRQQKIHGIENLYVAGSSVFPTSGAANPTLTIVAMTLRLADHLKARLQ
jgi:choline dehydrogenase-like flavoprotein